MKKKNTETINNKKYHFPGNYIKWRGMFE